MTTRTKTERIELRVDSTANEQILAAAAEVNEPTSEFVRNAALARAETVLALSHRTLMPPEQFDAMIKSLDEPDAAPNLARAYAQKRRFVRR